MIRQLLDALRLFRRRLDVWRLSNVAPVAPNLSDPAVVGECPATCEHPPYLTPIGEEIWVSCTRIADHGGYHVAFALDHVVCLWGHGLHRHERIEVDVVQSLSDALDEALPSMARVAEFMLRRLG